MLLFEAINESCSKENQVVARYKNSHNRPNKQNNTELLNQMCCSLSWILSKVTHNEKRNHDEQINEIHEKNQRLSVIDENVGYIC